MIPQNPIILLSYVNTLLRDKYKTLEELCKSEDIIIDELCSTLQTIDYSYDEKSNRFI